MYSFLDTRRIYCGLLCVSYFEKRFNECKICEKFIRSIN